MWMRAYAMWKVAYARGGTYLKDMRAPTKGFWPHVQKSATCSAAHTILATPKISKRLRKEPTPPTQPTPHCKTHLISLRNIPRNSFLSKFHHLKKNNAQMVLITTRIYCGNSLWTKTISLELSFKIIQKNPKLYCDHIQQIEKQWSNGSTDVHLRSARLCVEAEPHVAPDRPKRPRDDFPKAAALRELGEVDQPRCSKRRDSNKG